MTCAVPDCTAAVVMTGVCSLHWLEAEYGALAGDLRGFHLEVLRSRADELAAEQEARQRARELAQLRSFDSRERGTGIFDAICSRYWQEVSEGAGRNHALSAAAWAAGRLVAGGELGEAHARDTLIAHGVQAGLPHREAADVVRGQMKRAASRPRVLERKSEWTPDWTVRW